VHRRSQSDVEHAAGDFDVLPFAVYRVPGGESATPDFRAGHILGEYSALVAAGALKFAAAVARA